MARRKNRAFKVDAKQNSKFMESCKINTGVKSPYDYLQEQIRNSYDKHLSLESSVKLSLVMKDLALEYVRKDHELDDIPDDWYAYKVERNNQGDYLGEALHHGHISEGAKLGFYDALIYEEVEWFDSRFEAQAWAFTRAWLAFGSCDSFITGVRYSKRNRRFFAFCHEYE